MNDYEYLNSKKKRKDKKEKLLSSFSGFPLFYWFGFS